MIVDVLLLLMIFCCYYCKHINKLIMNNIFGKKWFYNKLEWIELADCWMSQFSYIHAWHLVMCLIKQMPLSTKNAKWNTQPNVQCLHCFIVALVLLSLLLLLLRLWLTFWQTPWPLRQRQRFPALSRPEVQLCVSLSNVYSNFEVLRLKLQNSVWKRRRMQISHTQVGKRQGFKKCQDANKTNYVILQCTNGTALLELIFMDSCLPPNDVGLWWKVANEDWYEAWWLGIL